MGPIPELIRGWVIFYALKAPPCGGAFLSAKLNRSIGELHMQGGHLAGFSCVEVEFSTVEEAEVFVTLIWFGNTIKVTATIGRGEQWRVK